MPDDLYDRDLLIWSERQADLLRRLAAGERVDTEVDWENVIEEVDAVGRSELRSVQSLLLQALVHLMKLAIEPESQAAAHRESECLVFLAQASLSLTPSMHRKLELDRIYATARRVASRVAAPVRVDCPFVLDDLLTEAPDIKALVGRLRE